MCESGLVDTEPLERHVSAVLEFIETRIARMQALSALCNLSIFAGFSSPSGGFTLDTSLLRRLSTLPFDVVLDLYPPEVADDPHHAEPQRPEDRRTSAVLQISSSVMTCDDVTGTLHARSSPNAQKGGTPGAWGAVWTKVSPLGERVDIEDHIAVLVDFLENRAAPVTELANRCGLAIMCRFASRHGQGGFTLESSLLLRLAALPVNLVIELHPYEEADAD
jgi:hypothetical protein